MKDQIIIPPENGWEEQTYYIVDVAFSKMNPIHNKIFYVGFLNNGFPAGYNQLFTNSDTGYKTIKDVYYLKALKKITGNIPSP